MTGLNKAEKMKQKMSNKGYTLIEVMVTMIIFSLVFGMISGLFALALKAQRRSLASQELLAQTSYVMEYMSRHLRMAQKQTSGPPVGCLHQVGANYEGTRGEFGIKFITYEGECWEFFLENDRLKQEIIGGDTAFLTSASLVIEEFNINLIGQVQPPADYSQPRVTLFLKIKGVGGKAEKQPIIEIQNTISQRNLDVE